MLWKSGFFVYIYHPPPTSQPVRSSAASDFYKRQELILLFLYLAYMSLNNAFDNPRTAAKSSSILALVGLVNLPIIHYSVKWWNTLHQGYSVGTGGLKDPDMQIALALMFIASIFLYALLVAIKAKTEVLIREQNSRWVQQEVTGEVS